MRIKTVTIKHNDAPLIINESDFREGSDELWKEPTEVEEPTEVKVKNEVQVKHKGAGRWVVLVNGKQAHDGTLTKVDAQALAAKY